MLFRSLDLGLGRGFSGSQAAKHLMGLAAANFAAGPGKKKRGDGVLLEQLGGGGAMQMPAAAGSAGESAEWGSSKE